MDKITINLATKIYAGKGIGIVMPVAIITLSAISFLYLRGIVADYTASINRIEKRVAELSETSQKKEHTATDMKVPATDISVAADILEQRSFSWIGALDNLEKALPPGVSLSSINPSFKGGGLQISGTARDFATLSRFIDNLEGLKVYKRVFLTGHSLKETAQGKDATMFSISIEGGK